MTILTTWRPWRQIDDSRKCDPSLDISIRKENTFECKRNPMLRHGQSGRVYKSHTWIREVTVDRLERLWSFVCSASWKAGELSAFQSAVIVVVSDLLTVCVAKS
ncbi:hypothetical protein AVEN_202355-1 [Araneus ventricosus]|uniref:Uncharacterized protein n=1 Tax=Araneus ventricosus TaxID=182803 RepID=A0A4Y2S6B2_ARAVE|nr:hypothetical protein AVEN_38130-1 [Araneus ventricosus]GBN82825.1 hypothetical protein AVEN_77502-1 [Araneus ventricosus]GBO37868.1 hypothetical protein AVEN_186445-1 [Araneus ventricosus]GBO37871.1 hypothetical protein AVEN_202355-1 [Araneus ventricosus]